MISILLSLHTVWLSEHEASHRIAVLPFACTRLQTSSPAPSYCSPGSGAGARISSTSLCALLETHDLECTDLPQHAELCCLHFPLLVMIRGVHLHSGTWLGHDVLSPYTVSQYLLHTQER